MLLFINKPTSTRIMKSPNIQKANKSSSSGLKAAGFKESRAGLDPALLLCCYIHILGPNVCRSKCKLCFTEIGFVFIEHVTQMIKCFKASLGGASANKRTFPRVRATTTKAARQLVRRKPSIPPLHHNGEYDASRPPVRRI